MFNQSKLTVLVLVVVAVIVGGYFVLAFWQSWRSFEETEPQVSELCIQVITPARNPSTGEVRDFPTPCDVPGGWEQVGPETFDTSGWQTYRNEEHGFEFRYPGDWGNLKANSSTVDDAKIIYFCSLNTIENYVEENCGTTFPGYARVFYIKILTDAQWLEEQSWVTNKSIYLNRNGDYIFASGMGQENISDISLKGEELDQILSTFKFVE